MTARIAAYLDATEIETPCLVLDLDRVEANYLALRRAMPDATIYYAMKANPAPAVLERLVRLGAHIDVASVREIEEALRAGAAAERLSYGNTIKKERDIATARRLGVDLFAFDSAAELRKLARTAAGARVVCRILASSDGADWPLSRKFGCAPDMAADLLRAAARMGLKPWGIAFHVGSQQRDPGQWDAAVADAAQVFHRLEGDGIELELLNLGGGFPTRYGEAVADVDAYAEAIGAAVPRHFGNRIPELVLEPGRALVGDAGVIATEIVLIAAKGDGDHRRWVYLDIGTFGGLAETLGEAIRYPIESHRGGPPTPVILAGPTCDSADILYERTPYHLPSDIRIGDRLRIKSTGAYTTTYSSVGFNGFAPLKQVCI